MTATMPKTNRHPVNSQTNEKTGERWYVHPITGERFVSVTTALKVIAKEALIHWSGKVVAEEAMERLPILVKASRIRPCGETRNEERRCGVCRDCAIADLRGKPATIKNEAADLGRRVHAAAERYTLTGDLDPADDDIAPFVAQYLAWRAQFKPTYEASEMTVINREYGYAGTLDGITRQAWLPPKHKDLIGLPMVGDIKSGKGVYSEAQLQMVAYKNAEAVLLPDGTEKPMPHTCDTAYVLHLRPDFYQVHPVPVPDAAFGSFLSALSLYRWWADENGEPKAIGRAMYKPPITVKSATAEASPKPRKSTPVAPLNTPAPRSTKLPQQPRLRDQLFPAHRSLGDRLSDSDIPF
jgi:hypothetical protein